MSAAGEIFDVKRFAVHDGPGIRSTAFLKGCPLRCRWCHNPEGLLPGPSLCRQPGACIGCGACAAACPAQAIAQGPQIAIDRTRCTRCGRCVTACPSGALRLAGRTLTARELAAELEKDRVFFQASAGGGITLSGGEPLFQPEFAHAVLEHAGAGGCHRAVETSLCAPARVVERLRDVVDLWICDLKLLDEREHVRLTGRSNRQILANYEWLARSGAEMLTRIPVIPGDTDTTENLTGIGRYVARVNPGGPVELMFYNPLGRSKYAAYGLAGGPEGHAPYTGEQTARLRELVAATGAQVI